MKWYALPPLMSYDASEGVTRYIELGTISDKFLRKGTLMGEGGGGEPGYKIHHNGTIVPLLTGGAESRDIS